MSPPVANPPAPDVEAIALKALDDELARDGGFVALSRAHATTIRTAVARLGARLDDERGAYLKTREWAIAAETELAAITAHTASLQARVEELERQVQSAEGVISTFQHANNLYREAMDERTTFKNQARAAEAEANRMREALGAVLAAMNDEDDSAAYIIAKAALRPADEPVTQREM